MYRKKKIKSPLLWFSSYKSLIDIKLSNFHDQYIENINVWIIIIKNWFYLYETLKNKKISNISGLFKSDALIWYLDLRRKFLRVSTWEEFKTELQIKFAQSSIRISHLRKSLKFILYHESHDMKWYISQFWSIDI